MKHLTVTVYFLDDKTNVSLAYGIVVFLPVPRLNKVGVTNLIFVYTCGTHVKVSSLVECRSLRTKTDIMVTSTFIFPDGS